MGVPQIQLCPITQMRNMLSTVNPMSKMIIHIPVPIQNLRKNCCRLWPKVQGFCSQHPAARSMYHCNQWLHLWMMCCHTCYLRMCHILTPLMNPCMVELWHWEAKKWVLDRLCLANLIHLLLRFQSCFLSLVLRERIKIVLQHIR